jgi:phospholipase/carboxylesterase
MTSLFDGIEMTIGNSTDAKDYLPKLSVIWLHGLGADGNDFAPVVPELEKLGVDHCRFIFPHAPVQPVTINGGMKMRSWYDITSLDFESRQQDATGINASAERVKGLIDREISRGVSADRIILAGFSQGGAVVLHTALRLDTTLAGVIALSTYLPLAENLASEQSDANQNTPIFMAHGRHDDVIEQRFAEAGRDILKAQGYKVQWQSYDMPHTLSMEEIVDLAAWIVSIHSGL